LTCTRQWGIVAAELRRPVPDFTPYHQTPPLEQADLRQQLLVSLGAEPAVAHRVATDLPRALDDVLAAQVLPPSARGSAMHQLTAASCAVLLRLGGANPASIGEQLRTRDLVAQRVLLEAILSRLVASQPPPTPVAPPAQGEVHTLSVRVAQDDHDKSVPRAVEHNAPPKATPAGVRPTMAETLFIRLDVGEGVSIDIDEAAQRVLRKPERRQELLDAIRRRLERYFGG
jgi:hypothetical protein